MATHNLNTIILPKFFNVPSTFQTPIRSWNARTFLTEFLWTPWCSVGKQITIAIRAVFKWLSKVITWLRLLRLVIGLKDSRQFFSLWKAKPKPIAPCTRDFSRATTELQVIGRNCDWFIALPAPVVIGRSNCFGFGFSTVILKPLYYNYNVCVARINNS